MKFLKFQNIKSWVITHKKTSIVIALVLVFGGYKAYTHFKSPVSAVQYISAKARKETIVSSVTGSGQVSASNQVEVASEVSGDVTLVKATLGQTIKKGEAIAYIDSSASSRSVENAELSLENAKISYDKSLKQSNNQAAGSSVSDLKKAYDDGYTEVSNTIIDIPDIIEGMDAIFYDPLHSPYFKDTEIQTAGGSAAIDYKYEAGRTFDQAKKDYDANFKSYKALGVNAASDKTVAVIQETYDTAKKLSLALTSAYNTVDYIKARMPADAILTQITADKNTLSSYITKVNNHMTALSNALTDIEDAKDSATTATLDLKSAQLNVSKAQDALRDAQEDLYNHTIRSPFDGIVAKLSLENGDKVNSGTAAATLITDQKVAEVSLNEVDISKVKVGQKADLTFDAIDDLKVEGTVTEVDLLGATEQGVVSYTVKIAFDQAKDDSRIKTGMSLSAAIVNDSKQDVVVVPNSAIKSRNNKYYVEVMGTNGKITSLPVETGLSNDESTEIISGINEGDSYIARTITTAATKTTTTTAAPSLFGGGARATTGGNAVRFQAR